MPTYSLTLTKMIQQSNAGNIVRIAGMLVRFWSITRYGYIFQVDLYVMAVVHACLSLTVYSGGWVSGWVYR